MPDQRPGPHPSDTPARAAPELQPPPPPLSSAAMRWLLHGPMTAAVGDALRRHKHEARDLAAIGLPPSADVAEVLRTAQAGQLDILTTDAALSAAPYLTDFWFQRSIVYLQLDGGDVEHDDAIDRLFERYKSPAPGRLYTVTASRVKVRQLPGRV